MAVIEAPPSRQKTGSTEAEWAWVEDLIRDVSREERTESLAKRVFQWDLAVRQFRKLEHERTVLVGPTPADLAGHARCLEGLLMIGRALALACNQHPPEELARFGLKQDEIEACVAALEQSFREWHHGFTEEHLEQIRKALFGGTT